ncbi:MAG TPA: energy transducer TonB [Pyrinomonadaceae bacterium]|nr:energy transducer TonB [Pyrinomonadaceae bacterium]
MKIKICSTAILFFLCSVQSVFAQEKVISGGIVNGKATKLPEPIYSREAKDSCASGEVKVEVLIDENGDVISAKAISGDELLRTSAVEAAKKAKFRTTHFQVKVRGIVVYNFVLKIKCIEVGIVNKKAKYLSTPIYPKSCRCQKLLKLEL